MAASIDREPTAPCLPRKRFYHHILETKYWKRKHHPLLEIQIYAYLEECSDDKVKEALELEGFWLGLFVRRTKADD